jgi:integrase
MTVFLDKKRGRWRYDFELGGARYARECLDPAGEPAASKRVASTIEAEAKRQARLVPNAPRSADLTLAQVFNDLTEIWQKQPGWSDRKRMVRELLKFFGPATAVRDIDGATIQDYIAFALRQPLRIWVGGPRQKEKQTEKSWSAHPTGKTRSPATVNRYLPLLRAAFNRAYQTRDPGTRERAIDDIPPIPKLAELKRKARPVPDEVLVDLMTTLPAHVVEALKLTLFFGFRRNEAFSLTIGQVDGDAGGIRLEAKNVKNRTDAFIPGSRRAMQFLAQLADQARNRGTRQLITWRGLVADEKKLAVATWRPIKSPKSAWTRAMGEIEKRYGRRWRWHDIRAAYITQIAMTSGPIAAQKLARHSDFKTTAGYVEVADDVIRAAAETASDRAAFGIKKHVSKSHAKGRRYLRLADPRV